MPTTAATGTTSLPAALLSVDVEEPPVAVAGFVACTWTPCTAVVADGVYEIGEKEHCFMILSASIGLLTTSRANNPEMEIGNHTICGGSVLGNATGAEGHHAGNVEARILADAVRLDGLVVLCSLAQA